MDDVTAETLATQMGMTAEEFQEEIQKQIEAMMKVQVFPLRPHTAEMARIYADNLLANKHVTEAYGPTDTYVDNGYYYGKETPQAKAALQTTEAVRKTGSSSRNKKAGKPSTRSRRAPHAQRAGEG